MSGDQSTYPPPESGFVVPPALRAINETAPSRHPGHIITGPVAVEGAKPGDTLEVRIEAIEFGADWGFCGFRPLAGTLPEDFPESFLSHIAIDRARGVCRLPHGLELKLAPFFGVMGVAPPPAYGAISTIEPREHGGNLDNNELSAGSRLFLPVWAHGALFSAGDGHGVQGDGEVCINALEMCLTGTCSRSSCIVAAPTEEEPRRCAIRAHGNAHAFHFDGHEQRPGSGDETGLA